MLARKIKIRTLEVQKAKLEEALLELRTTGRYVHDEHVYPENVKHFEEQGFEVKVSDNGGEVVFTVRDDIILTEDELRQSEDEASYKICLD